VGFLGPKVHEALHGQAFPADVQTADHLAAGGVIDAVVELDELHELVDRALAVLVDPPTGPSRPRPGTTEPAERDAWQAVEHTRNGQRVGVRDLLRHAATDTLRLHGTGAGERDDTVLTALTRLDGRPCVLVGQDRARQSPAQALGPAALRQAQRAMRLAEELRLPLVTVVDTPGAALSVEAEEGALAGEIARCLAVLTTMTVPTVSVLLGEGCGGAALALFPARTRIALADAWLSPLPPEGASAIVHGDPGHAAQLAREQSISATALYRKGFLDHVLDESASAPADLAGAVAALVAHAIADATRLRA